MATVSRRSFIQLTGSAALAAALTPLLAACGSAAAPASSSAPAAGGSTAASAKPSTPASSAAAKPSGGAVKLPTYAQVQGPKPDLPGDDKIDAGYFSFPKSLIKSVKDTPIKGGGDVNVVTWNVTGQIAPLDNNAAWQQINKEIGANVKLNTVTYGNDYLTKIYTVIAGGDLPDIMYIPASAAIPQYPEFLKQSAADLTPYLSGDAIKAYPNLANIPTNAWRSTIFNNAIYGVPVSFPIVPGSVLWQFQDVLQEAGAGNPKDTDDFKKILAQLKKPDQNFFGIGSYIVGASQTGGAYDLSFYSMAFGAPNNWSESGGKLTRNFETEQYKAAIGYVKDLVTAGVYSPDSATNNIVKARSAFSGKHYAFNVSGWLAAAAQYWSAALSMKPAGKLGLTPPFGAPGSKGSFFTGQQLFGYSIIKKTSEARIKDLLAMMNYLAAPFGSEEHLLLNYGVKGTDFNFDDSGNPVLTTKGKTDVNSLWGYIVAPPQVYYNTAQPKEFATMMQNEEKALVAVGVADPVGALYSATNASKGPVINQKLLDGVGDILAGRRPMSDYDGLVKEWKSSGGDQIRTEFEQALAASKA